MIHIINMNGTVAYLYILETHDWKIMKLKIVIYITCEHILLP